MNNKKYISPKIETYIIQLEESIAAGSTNIVFGGGSASNYPEIEDWTDTNGNTSGGFTLDGQN
ncbi:hypothetical protein LZQ00_04005 [Sphingobacterium sp. SRCM116780]|uniref:hypothetical protein n=1 Tax=Sphingobacterium sp. SRCM116780 TaxID=2907623 RepID=UPI001F459D48|nr:hypothetical protein [Sphingobacterium sp. SRCM116780]UIR56983.1 hypothetical protein LZQ00_04005 [Sphingobacterium sp. SRCM116780]